MEAKSPPRYSAAQRRRALQFAIVGTLVPVAIATAIDFSSHHTIFFVGAAIGWIAPIVVTLIPRRNRAIFYLAAFGGLPGLAMMLAYSGGAASGYAVLMMMAMIWFGLQATDRELIAGVIVLAACSYLPMLVFGPPAYPVEWGHATLLVLIGSAVAGSLRTLTRETQRLTARLRQEAIIDPLTGLLNRRGWEDAAARELARSGRESRPVALVTIDLDRLKHINDTMGHGEGDRVLRETGDRLRRALRASDVVARLGGDEFAALLTESSVDEALGAVQRLREVTPPLGAFSAGVGVWNGREEIDELLRRGDLALYAAKAAGGDRVELAGQAFDTPADVHATS